MGRRRGGVKAVDGEQGALIREPPTGAGNPTDVSSSGSDSSFVGEPLAEAATMVATAATSGGRRYHTRQATSEQRGRGK